MGEENTQAKNDMIIVWLAFSLRAIAQDLEENYKCRCGEDPFDNGNPCTRCFAIIVEQEMREKDL